MNQYLPDARNPQRTFFVCKQVLLAKCGKLIPQEVFTYHIRLILPPAHLIE